MIYLVNNERGALRMPDTTSMVGIDPTTMLLLFNITG